MCPKTLPKEIAIQIFLVCRFKNGKASAGALRISESAQAFIPKEMYPATSQIRSTVCAMNLPIAWLLKF
jgi:hypothetical protein